MRRNGAGSSRGPVASSAAVSRRACARIRRTRSPRPSITARSTSRDGAALRRALAGSPGGPPDVVANAAAMTHVDRCEARARGCRSRQCDGAGRARGALPGDRGAAGARLDRLRVRRHSDTTLHRNGSHGTAQRLWPHQARRRATRAGRATRRARRAHGWVFGPGRNFVRTILEAAARARRGEAPALRVVDDQRGSPTYAGDLADGIVGLVDAGASGIFHLANTGVASWWDLARAAVDIWGHPELPIEKVRTDELPRPAPRPAWSVLDTSKAGRLGVRLRTWRDGLRGYLDSDASPLRELGAFVVSGRKLDRVLVTGGAGFLGSHLCERLLADGCEVICFDNLLTGRMDNIQPLLGHPQASRSSTTTSPTSCTSRAISTRSCTSRRRRARRTSSGCRSRS